MDKQINSQKMLKDLVKCGMNDYAIRDALIKAGTPTVQSTIFKLRKGITKSPRIDLYFAIQRLHKKIMKK